MKNNIFLTIIIPHHKKFGNIRNDLKKLIKHFEKKPFRSEILIFSGNKTQFSKIYDEDLLMTEIKIFENAQKQDISQSQAYIMGFKEARGEWAMLIDTDMLDLTKSIDKLIYNMEQKKDVIRTFRKKREKLPLSRRIGTKAVNFVFNLGEKTKLKDVGSSLSAYRKNIYSNVFDEEFTEFYNFLPFLVRILCRSEKILEIPIEYTGPGTQISSYSILSLFIIFMKIIYLKIKTRSFGRPLRSHSPDLRRGSGDDGMVKDSPRDNWG